MKHLKATVLGSAIAIAMMASGSALATVIVQDGIQFNSGAVFQSAQLYETQVSPTSSTLSGFGMINSINGDTHYCVGGTANCQLTFTFDNYTVTHLGANDVEFSGGTITFYAYSSYVFDPANPSTASMGSVFLTTKGHTFNDPTYGNGTLIATTSFPGSFLSNQFQGHGTGLLDVTGGDASSYFNTNTFTDNLMGLADIQFISDFSPNTCEGTAAPSPYTICGSGTAKSVAAVAVPEPNALGMMGLGLAGLAMLLTWRRKGKKAV